MNKVPAHNMQERPPVVVVMGHVDHGKSTLLDYIRSANTVAGEAGGITQKVAAYEVEKEHNGTKKRLTFIDTPGHAAFKSIRARGANIADIAVLVVAADDGVKAQTLEALAAIRESEIPFIVAINKIDKPNADLTRTQTSLLEQKVFLEKFGGDIPWAAISAKSGQGVPELLNLILLVAELQELKADASLPAEGYCIEAHRDPKRGIAATLIITKGTLETGTALCVGGAIAPVRLMEDYTGRALKTASFSTPVSVVGFDALPDAGSAFQSFINKRAAEEYRSEHASERAKSASTDAPTETAHVVPLIVRADSAGGLEAVLFEISKIGDEHARPRVVQSGIGTISENDVKAARASADHAVVIGFNVPLDATAREHARKNDVVVETFDIIYKLTEYVEEFVKKATPKRTIEEALGVARVLKQFSTHKETHVVGGKVQEGKIERGALVRIVRRSVEIGIGKVTNLQSHKQNVERVETGSEFGAEITASFEIAAGDSIQCFRTVVV